MRTRGFTLLELLIAMAMFSILGLAVVALLGQGMTLFAEGTADTSMQDRLQAILPSIRADFAAIQPVSMPEVLPPPPSDIPATTMSTAPAPPPSRGPAIRLRSGWTKLTDVPTEWPPVFYVAFARTNARESEDPILRTAGTPSLAGGAPPRAYDASVVDSATPVALLATGGLLEEVWIAVPEDPAPDRRNGPPAPDSSWSRSVLTLYRLFRAPVGGDKSLLVLENFNSLSKIRASGRVMHEGVLHFGVTWRNVFSRSWTDGVGGGKAADGQPYIGSVWDSTRGLDKDFPLFRGADSLGDVRDDVFPAWARIELTLAIEGPYGFGRGETTLSDSLTVADKRIRVESLEPLYKPSGGERWLKVGTEWMSMTLEGIEPSERRVTVGRGRRGTLAVEHAAGEPVFVGSGVSTDVPTVYKDRYARSR